MGKSRWRRVVLPIVVITAVSAGCSSEPTADTLPADVTTLLATAAETMGTVDTVSFTLERSGAPVYIDDQDLLAFESADGRFAAPSSADALVTIKAIGITTRVGAVAIDGSTYLTNPVTGKWEPAPAGYTFDPATLFDPDLGWRPLLAGGLEDVQLLDSETGDDGPRYHVRGTADADRVAVITAGLVTGEAVTLDLWLDPSDGAVREAEFSTTTSAGQSEWRLTFDGYGEPVEITPPDLDGAG